MEDVFQNFPLRFAHHGLLGEFVTQAGTRQSEKPMHAKTSLRHFRLRNILRLGVFVSCLEFFAHAASVATTVQTGENGRLLLQIHAEEESTVQVDMSTDLQRWRPYLVTATSPENSFRAEVPTNTMGQSFFQIQNKPDSNRPLKPMAFIPGGTFLMGQEEPYASSSLGLPVAGPVHEVTLSPFRMDIHEVTVAEWRTVKSWATDPSRGDNVYDFRHDGSGQGPDHPITIIDWFDTVKWANARSEMEGLPPVYFTDTTLTKVYRKGILEISNQCVAWSGEGYRLPTEAEWEYAARGGLHLKIFPWGDEYPQISQVNYAYLYDGTTEVGLFSPNAYGLFDMAGNVREWCWDLHKDDPSITYTNHRVFAPYDPWPQTNPHGPDTGPRGMSRGGSFLDTQHYVQCGRRHNDERDRLTVFTGFRLVRREPLPFE